MKRLERWWQGRVSAPLVTITKKRRACQHVLYSKWMSYKVDWIFLVYKYIIRKFLARCSEPPMTKTLQIADTVATMTGSQGGQPKLGHLKATIVCWWRWRKERELALFMIWQLNRLWRRTQNNVPQRTKLHSVDISRWRWMCGSTSRGWWLQRQRGLKR